MELIDIDLELQVIRQHNLITSGKYDYSACMMDIMFMILAGLEVGKREYTIHAKDIEAITGRMWNYKRLKTSTEIIGSRMFEIETPGKTIQLWLFSKIEYLSNTGSFCVKLNDEAMPYLFDLKNNFTSMELKSTLSVTSKYAKRLYALACQWRSKGVIRYKISELKDMLGLIDEKGKECYGNISEFKSKVLNIARKQINEDSDITFDYKLIKRGRSFQLVEFYINTQKPKQLEIDFNEPIDIQKFKSKIMNYGLNEEQAENIAIKENEADFDALILSLNEKIRQKKISINNGVGYLVGIYQKKGFLYKKEK
jgi:plasmid replication initiation protein